jgi:hypothetical protein
MFNTHAPVIADGESSGDSYKTKSLIDMKTNRTNVIIKNFMLAFSASLMLQPTVGNAQGNPTRQDLIAGFKDYPHSKHRAFIAKVFDCDENKKLHAFTLLLTPGGCIQFGSNQKITGRENIEKMLVEFNNGFKHLSQHMIRVFKDTEKEIVYSADATYLFDDGTSTIPIPYMVHLVFNGDLVSDYKIYIDLAPFYKHQPGQNK